MISHTELLVRIVVGAALGGVIGYERDRHQRPAGLRTHLIVAMASATFMVLSTHFVYWQHYSKEDLVGVDPSRIAASVVAGIGFLAGGAILRTGLTIQGLTTAAGLWLVTAIGMCAGAGMYPESVVVTGLGITALTVLRRFEDKDVVRHRLAVVLDETSGGVASVLAALTTLEAVATDVEYEKWFGDEHKHEITLDAQFPTNVSLAKLVETLESVSGVRRVRVQRQV